MSFIKIHGSTNWFSCVSCNNIVNLELEAENFVYNDAIEEKCFFCYNKAGINEIQLQPEIITPILIKEFDSQLFNNIWKSAYDELISADKIIFIGYSLPIADFEFRYLLKKGVQSNSKINVVLWKTDNLSICEKYEKVADLLPETRYRRLFYGKQINFYYEGFTAYFDNLIKKIINGKLYLNIWFLKKLK